MTSEELEQQANAIAREHDQDPDRVHSLLMDLSETMPPSRRPAEELCTAIGYMGPSQALDALEMEDLKRIAAGVVVVDYLMDSRAPLYTLGELAQLTEMFLAYLQRNRNNIIATGHPRTKFGPSPLFDLHLTRLYYVKRPIVVNACLPPFDQLADRLPPDCPAETERDEYGDLVYHYRWADQPPRPPFRREFRRPGESDADLGMVVHTYQLPYEFQDFTPLAEDGTPARYCEYEEAANMSGCSEEEAVRLPEMREDMFDLRRRILGRLLTAARQEDASGLWDDCLSELSQTLLADKARYLVNIDRRYAEPPNEDIAVSPTTLHFLPDGNGGLTELLTVIGHFEEEIEFGIMHHTREVLKSELPSLRVDSYYQAIGQPWRRRLNEALAVFSRLVRDEDRFWGEYAARVEEALSKRLNVEIVVSAVLPAVFAEAGRAQLEMHADWLKSGARDSGFLPQINAVHFVRYPEEVMAPSTRIQDVVPFTVLEGTTWEQVVVEFWNDETVKIMVGSLMDHKTYEDMGFVNRRTRERSPDLLWVAFRELAEKNGQLTWQQAEGELPPEVSGSTSGGPGLQPARLSESDTRALAKWKKRISDISKRLENYFPTIEGRPFCRYSSKEGYRTKFVLQWAESYRNQS